MNRSDNMKGNAYARKSDEERITKQGRIVVDLGDLKFRAVEAAQARGMKLTQWIREAVVAQIIGDELQDHSDDAD